MRFVLVTLIVAVCVTGGFLSVSFSGELQITNVQANMSLPTPTGSVWMTISNGTGQNDELIGAVIDGCGVVELHEMVMDNAVMKMRQVSGGKIPIPSGKVVELKQGGLHIMCIDKKEPLPLGKRVSIILHFSKAGDVEVEGKVVQPGMMKKNNHSHHHN